jgi:aspartyl-tRNA(Asn)/glutamyl-tRNA(Gln) amidotransferase subunit C
MEFDDKKMESLMKSSVLELTTQEKIDFKDDLKNIFNYIENLKLIPTDHVNACTHPLQELGNVVRDDEIKPSLDRQLFLDNSPAHIGAMIRVPTIIHKD